MADTKQVMSWLEGLTDDDWPLFHSHSEVQNIAEAALELLKEQETVKPEVEVLNEIDRIYRCPKCHKFFFYEKQKHCDKCGQAVKWDE